MALYQDDNWVVVKNTDSFTDEVNCFTSSSNVHSSSEPGFLLVPQQNFGTMALSGKPYGIGLTYRIDNEPSVTMGYTSSEDVSIDYIFKIGDSNYSRLINDLSSGGQSLTYKVYSNNRNTPNYQATLSIQNFATIYNVAESCTEAYTEVIPSPPAPQSDPNIKGTWSISWENSYIHTGTMLLDYAEFNPNGTIDASGLYYAAGLDYGLPINCTQESAGNDYSCKYQKYVSYNTAIWHTVFNITFSDKNITGYQAGSSTEEGEQIDDASIAHQIQQMFYPVSGYKVSNDLLLVPGAIQARYNEETGNLSIPVIKAGGDYFSAEIAGPYNIINIHPLLH